MSRRPAHFGKKNSRSFAPRCCCACRNPVCQLKSGDSAPRKFGDPSFGDEFSLYSRPLRLSLLSLDLVEKLACYVRRGKFIYKLTACAILSWG